MPNIIPIGKCLLKLQLKMSGCFFETQCIILMNVTFDLERLRAMIHDDIAQTCFILRYNFI